MKRIGPILLLIATLAIITAMYFVQSRNSGGHALGSGWIALDVFLALPLIFIIATAIWLLRTPKSHKQSAFLTFIERRLGSRTVGPATLSVMAIIVVISLLCWMVALFLIYVADDLTSPAVDERSVPASAARPY